ncbi:MAG: tRNA (adenosine(37)-N6)-dimethylallyltransferase MiaA [Oscillospiraceae bacterium]|nr:tRNA (adenosine(37)-N6)-dimethylallyltransferase MiaA [Oscillospiraceae bacterium]
MSKKTFIVVVCGATASGKTALAVDLAERFGGEIIGSDSMQIYKGMSIATAKPTAEELRGIPHHLIDFLEPREVFSVADYVELARAKITEVTARGKLPILCGGTGLYINSLIDNIEFAEVEADMDFRAKMQKREAAELLDELRFKDPEAASELHENNKKRVIRALEVLHVTGKTMSEHKAASRLNPSPYEPLMLRIEFHRNELYERIDRRVDLMLEAGLLSEAQEFYRRVGFPRPTENTQTATQAIGCKELLPYLSGEAELAECIENLKKITRNYAKRQLTWFKKDSRIHLLTPEKAFIEAEKLILNVITQIS